MTLRRSLAPMGRLAVVALTGAALLAVWTPPASAMWSAAQDGNSWAVREGNTKIPMPDQKTAESVAKDFNKIDDKADKRANKGDKKDKGGSK